jgi:hypothetical protein
MIARLSESNGWFQRLDALIGPSVPGFQSRDRRLARRRPEGAAGTAHFSSLSDIVTRFHSWISFVLLIHQYL